MFSFQNKLKLFTRDLKSNNSNNFPCLEKIKQWLIKSETQINCENYALTFLMILDDKYLNNLKTIVICNRIFETCPSFIMFRY